MQATYAPASSLQRKLTPASESVKEKLGLVVFERLAGFAVIEGVGGAAVSTVQV